MRFRPGFRPEPRCGSSRRYPDSLVGWRDDTLPIPHFTQLPRFPRLRHSPLGAAFEASVGGHTKYFPLEPRLILVEKEAEGGVDEERSEEGKGNGKKRASDGKERARSVTFCRKSSAALICLSCFIAFRGHSVRQNITPQLLSHVRGQ